ncbi:Ubiquinone biosynthesis O-methyltransferase [Tumidithrix helvetica PCC 7403]
MKSYRTVYQAHQFPVFQNRMFSSKQEAENCVKGDINLVQDLETGLIFNQAFNSDLMQYDTNYQNEQAVSNIFQKHLKNVSKIIQKHFDSYSLIEVGCGKGHFLEHLQDLGFKIIGIDPTYEGESSSVIKKCFSPEIGICADGIILRHVLEHVQDPVEFILSIRDSNGGGGKIYIEVPCFNWICDHCAWFDIFYEHVNYFQLDDFYRMFEVVYGCGHIFGGQYLYVVADLAKIRLPKFKKSALIDFPKNFLDTFYQYTNSLRNRNKKSFAIWGGASKGVIFALFLQRAGIKIETVIDINPAKQGKYLAGTGLLVQSPTEALKNLLPSADIFVMNSNYLSEIIDLTNNKFNYLTVD